MNDTILGIGFLVILLVGLVVAARYLERHSKSRGPIGGDAIQINLPPPGPITKALRFATLSILLLMVVMIVAGFVTRSAIWYDIGAGLFVLTLVLARVRHFARLSGK